MLRGKLTTALLCSTMLGGPVMGALALIGGETDGFAIDATTGGGTVAVKDVSTPANNLNNVALDASNLVNNSAGAKYVLNQDLTLSLTSVGDIPRSWDAILGQYGILCERAATNVCTRSQEFDNAAWTKNQTTISANATTAPDGTSTADKIVEDAVTNEHEVISATAAVTASQIYTASVYLKPAGRQQVELAMGFGSNGVRLEIDLVTKTVDVAASYGGGSYVSHSYTDLANGWVRLALTGRGDVADTSAVVAVKVLQDMTGSQIYAGDGTSGLYVWGAQHEIGRAATSYIPTTTAAATRARDEVDALVSSYPHNATEGTFIFWFRSGVSQQSIGTQVNARLFSINNNTSAERMYIQCLTASDPNVMSFNGFAGGSEVIQASSGIGVNAAVGNRVATFYKANDSGILVDGGSQVVDSSVTLPTVTDLNIGYEGAQASRDGHFYIYQMTYLPRRMSVSEMQALTT